MNGRIRLERTHFFVLHMRKFETIINSDLDRVPNPGRGAQVNVLPNSTSHGW